MFIYLYSIRLLRPKHYEVSVNLHNSSANLLTRTYRAIDENVRMTHLLPVSDLKMGFSPQRKMLTTYSGSYIPISNIKKNIKY